MKCLNSKYYPDFASFTKSITEVLSNTNGCYKKELDPRKIAATDFNVFVRHVTSTDRGARQISRLKTIHAGAAESMGLPVDEAAVYEAGMLVERFKAVELRFNCQKQVIRLAGLDLNASRSGKKCQESVPVISKKGDAKLRYGLYQAAVIASYHNDAFCW
jgi:transposase